MLWFSVWFVLVVGTLLGAFLLGRRLWRSGRDLLHELEKASELLARLETLQEEAQRRFPAPVPPTPSLDPGLEARARFSAVVQEHRQAVAHRRSRRLARAMAHWREVGSPL